MSKNNKRKSHHYHPNPATPLQGKQKTNGQNLWALLLALFGLLIALFAFGTNPVALLVGALAGGALGYFLGTKMEADAGKK